MKEEVPEVAKGLQKMILYSEELARDGEVASQEAFHYLSHKQEAGRTRMTESEIKRTRLGVEQEQPRIREYFKKIEITIERERREITFNSRGANPSSILWL